MPADVHLKADPATVRPSPVDRVVREALPLVAVLVAMAAAVARACQPLDNDDTYLHLRVGHEFLGGWSLRNPGSVSTLGTRDWVPTQWLSQVVMARAEDAGGLAAVAWLAGAAYLTYALALYLSCRRQSPPLVAGVVTLLALGATTQGISARPQMLSYILVVVTTAVWLSSIEARRTPWWLIPLTWVWAMLHGMWPVGILIGLAVIVGAYLDHDLLGRPLLRCLLVPAGSLGAALLTPVGPRLLREVLVVNGRGEYFAEWGPTEFTDGPVIVLVLMLAFVVVVMARGSRPQWTHLALLLMSGGWAVYSARTVPVAAALLAPVAAAAAATMVPAAVARTRDTTIAVAAWAGGLALLAVLTPQVTEPASQAADGGPATTAFLDALPDGTIVLNEWGWGGYVMWRHPQLQPVLHGYGDMFTTAELERNADISSLRAGWDQRLADTGARIAFLDPDSRLAYTLRNVAHWERVEGNDEAEVLRAPD